MKKFKLSMILVLVMMLPFIFGNQSGCESDATKASRNLSTAADQFEVQRQIIFYNGITDKYIVEIEGKCSVEFKTLKFEVTCKIGKDEFKKEYLGRADNVFPIILQSKPIPVDVFKTRIIFKPENIIPDIDLVTSG